MNQAYTNMRRFWMDATNFENRNGLIEVGPDKIIAAGVEMAVLDGQKLKHLFVATNSLGDSSLYFENNSPSGLGGQIGGHDNEPLQQAAAHMLAYAGKFTSQMQKLPVGQDMPATAVADEVGIWALSQKNCFYVKFTQEQLRQAEHPFYPVFAYSQQMIGFFQTQKPSSHPPARA